jgi:hypothetical protein
MTISKRNKDLNKKPKAKKNNTLKNSTSNFPKHEFKNREIEFEDGLIVTTLLLKNIFDE